MRKLLTALALAAPIVLAGATPASANTVVTVPGCYGAVVTFCDTTVTVPVATYWWGTPVCAGSCTWVSAPWAYYTGGPTCVTYHDAYGYYSSVCV